MKYCVVFISGNKERKCDYFRVVIIFYTLRNQVPWRINLNSICALFRLLLYLVTLRKQKQRCDSCGQSRHFSFFLIFLISSFVLINSQWHFYFLLFSIIILYHLLIYKSYSISSLSVHGSYWDKRKVYYECYVNHKPDSLPR